MSDRKSDRLSPRLEDRRMIARSHSRLDFWNGCNVRNTVTPPTVIDLFCGAGGLSLGFSRAGFQSQAAFDNWQPAVETYRANLGDHVRRIAITYDLEIPRPTVIVGGPPCQGFSSAGMRRADDVRNSLVGEYSRLIARVRPAAFVFENVEGFLTGSRGDFVLELLEPLIEAGYRIHLRKINAAHFGVPQHRKRVIGIGGLGWNPSFPEPTHAAFGTPGAQLANGMRTRRTPTLADALRALPPASRNGHDFLADHDMLTLSEDDLRRAKLLEQGQTMRDLPEELWHESYRKRAFRRVMDGTPSERRGGAPAGVRRLRADEPSKAVTGGVLREFIHPTEDRPLTLRECATLQTFPSDFQFHGSVSEKAQLIGNAVPPLLAQQIASTLRQDLDTACPIHPAGALLSFVPTLSTGMSPVLEEVTRRVKQRFMSGTKQKALQLWD